LEMKMLSIFFIFSFSGCIYLEDVELFPHFFFIEKIFQSICWRNYRYIGKNFSEPKDSEHPISVKFLF
jgi:hypothetical protein